MIKKLMELAAGLGKVFLPAAADLVKLGADLTLKFGGKLGKRALHAVKKKKTRGLVRKGRKLLRITALVSGCVTVLSVAGLILSRKK